MLHGEVAGVALPGRRVHGASEQPDFREVEGGFLPSSEQTAQHRIQGPLYHFKIAAIVILFGFGRLNKLTIFFKKNFF